MLYLGERVGIFTAFDFILLEIDWLVNGISVCLHNAFVCVWFFNQSLLLLSIAQWKAVAYVLLNERAVPKISYWHLDLLALIMLSLINSHLPGSFQKEED